MEAELKRVKKTIVKWEDTFKEAVGRAPTSKDIGERPEIAASYVKYASLKKSLQNGASQRPADVIQKPPDASQKPVQASSSSNDSSNSHKPTDTSQRHGAVRQPGSSSSSALILSSQVPRIQLPIQHMQNPKRASVSY
jgi:hypothetical protein